MRNYLLLTPGPLSTSETVRQAMLQDWCTWDKDYNEDIVSVIRLKLLDLAEANEIDYSAVLMQGSGTYSVEATLGSAVTNSDRLLIFANGAYGQRMGEIARYYHLNHEIIVLTETEAITGAVIEKGLEDYPNTTHVAVVHCETTTGILNPLDEIAAVLKGREITFIVDAMSSFGGIPIEMEKLGIDFLISSSNKCIQGVPGFGFVIANRTKLIATQGVARSLSLDLFAQWKTMEQEGGKWRFTSPTHVVRAFYQALVELQQEGGIQARYQRYLLSQKTLVEGMEQLGFKALLPKELHSPIITSFLYPDDQFRFESFYEQLKAKGFVIYPGKISNAETFRIGNIGDVYPKDIEALIQTIIKIR